MTSISEFLKQKVQYYTKLGEKHYFLELSDLLELAKQQRDKHDLTDKDLTIEQENMEAGLWLEWDNLVGAILKAQKGETK